MAQKKEERRSFTPAVITAAIGGVAAKGEKDIKNISQKLKTWDESLAGYRDIASTRKMTTSEASKAIDTYIKGGRDVAGSRILGVKAGKPVVGTYRTAISFIESRGKKLKPWEKEKLDAVAEHYRLFTDKRIPHGNVKAHMIEKGLTMGAIDDWRNPEVFTSQAKSIIKDPKTDLAQKLKDLKATKHTRAAEVTEKAVIGGEGILGESIRLVGDKKGVMSTPEIYRTSSRSVRKAVIKGLNIGKKVALPLAGVLVAAPLYGALKKEAAKKPKEPMLPESKAIALGGGAIATGAVATAGGVKRIVKPTSRIGVTYGTMPYIGEGHKYPGKAIIEALEKDPVVKKKFKVEALERDPHALYRGKGRRYATIVDTGLGLEVDKNVKWFNPTRFTHGQDIPKHTKAEKYVRYLTDVGHPETDYYGSTFKWDKPKGTTMLTYGDPATVEPLKGKGVKVRHMSTGMTPALRSSVLENLAKQPRESKTVLDDIITHHRSKYKSKATTAGERIELADDIKRLRSAKGKKLVTISGSGRGDYVISRAKELHESLGKAGLGKDYKVVALMGGGDLNLARKALKKTDVAVTGFLPNKIYNEIQGASTLNWGSTGTSVISESMLQKNIQAIPKEWGYTYEKGVKPGTIAAREEKLLGAGRVPHKPLDTWNIGNIAHGLKQKGVVKANKAEDIVNVLKDPAKVKELSEASRVRATEELAKTHKGRKNLVDEIVRSAKQGRTKIRLRGAAMALGGIGLAGAGSMFLRKKIKQEPVFPKTKKSKSKK